MTHSAVAVNWPLAIDQHSLSWQWGDHQYTVYFASGSDEVSEDLLYRCEDLKHQTGFLFGSSSERYSVVSRHTNAATELLYFIRSVARQVFELFVPVDLFKDASHRHSPLLETLDVVCVALTWYNVVVIGPVPTLIGATIFSTIMQLIGSVLELNRDNADR